jgi:hypothetical protein
MRMLVRTWVVWLAAALGVAAMAGAAEAPVPAADIVPGTWQHHKMTINYFGITSLYSCDGLEDHVRSILLHLGARKDAKVNANGCPRGQEVPSHNAWIATDFYTLEPAASASAPDTVRAYWALRELTPQRPYFMGEGDCELVEQMKDLISKSFALRDLSYRTECVPHELTLDGFAVKGQALVPAPSLAPPANQPLSHTNGFSTARPSRASS